jgi:predicted nucleotidyltransferase
MAAIPEKSSMCLQKLKFELDAKELLSEYRKLSAELNHSEPVYDREKLLSELFSKIQTLKLEFDKLLSEAFRSRNYGKVAAVRDNLESSISLIRTELKRRRQFFEIYNALGKDNPFRLKVTKCIFDFVSRLLNQIVIHQVLLFGSHASGKAHAWSDIDIAIISPEFEQKSRFVRKSFLAKAAIEANASKIQAIGFTPSEWSSQGMKGFSRIVKSTAITIMSFNEKQTLRGK